MNIYLDIEKLLAYAQVHLLLDDLDVIYARNLILDELGITEYVQYEVDADTIDNLTAPGPVLDPLVNYAAETGVITAKNKAKFAAKVMSLLVKRPGELADIYFDLEPANPQKASAWLEDYLAKCNRVNAAEVYKSCGIEAKAAKAKPAGNPEPAVTNAGVEKLLAYAQAHLLLDDLDVPTVRNFLAGELKIENYAPSEIDEAEVEELGVPDAVLEPVLAYAVETGVISAADQAKFSDRIMNCLTKRPSEINDIFYDLHQKSPQRAFEWLYDYAVKSNYVNFTAVAKNRHWEAKGTKGKIEVTVNLSRPENSNQDVEKAASEKGGKYPLCKLCKENEGYSAKGMFRKTLRTVPVTLGGEEWFWQYSPYSYFNQHGCAINSDHIPMKVDRSTFIKLFDFTDFNPAYFIGCNASLPRIGGSILAHDHFQGGKPVMPMFRAPVLKKLKSEKHPYIKIEMPDWYNSVIRISYTNKERLADFAEHLRAGWEVYSDESSGVLASTGGVQYNGVTAVARKMPDGNYCLDIIFRNNRTTKELPDGVFAARPEHQPIKSESVGLTESMGWFILPGRLEDQLLRIQKFLTKEARFSPAKLDPDLVPFTPIIEKLIKEAGSGKLSGKEAELNVKDEVNRICECILEDTAVFKKDEAGQAAFKAFLKTVGIE